MSSQLRWDDPLLGVEGFSTGGLARALHDGPVQTLASVLFSLEAFRRDQAAGHDVTDQVVPLQERIRDALIDIRQLVYDLRGLPGVEQDFSGRLRADLLRRFEYRTGISVRLSVGTRWPPAITAQAAMNLYRIIQEGLRNIERHSGAARACVSLRGAERDHLATLHIIDDGRGFGAAEDHDEGMGLRGIRERVVLLGGEMTLRNRPGRRGGMVVVRVPQSSLEPAT
jgi:signal transduction histidine kinase